MRNRTLAIGLAAVLLLAGTAAVVVAGNGPGECTEDCDGTPDQTPDP